VPEFCFHYSCCIRYWIIKLKTSEKIQILRSWSVCSRLSPLIACPDKDLFFVCHRFGCRPCLRYWIMAAVLYYFCFILCEGIIMLNNRMFLVYCQFIEYLGFFIVCSTSLCLVFVHGWDWPAVRHTLKLFCVVHFPTVILICTYRVSRTGHMPLCFFPYSNPNPSPNLCWTTPNHPHPYTPRLRTILIGCN